MVATAQSERVLRPPITERLARFAVSTRLEEIPPAVRTRAKASFLDALGSAVAGTAQPAPRIVAEHVRALGIGGTCTAIRHKLQCDPAHAALINGAAVGAARGAGHAGVGTMQAFAAVAPAAWAMGERTLASGAGVLVAHIVGTEVAARIGAGVEAALRSSGWDPDAVLGTFGAAAAASRLLGLDGAAMQNALGIAAGEASGIRVAAGTMSEPYGVGRSARDGIRAAILASKGFTGPADVIEARDGFLQTFGEGIDGSGIIDRFDDAPAGASAWEQTVDRFRALAEGALGAKDSARLVSLVQDLEALDDLRVLMGLLR